MKHFCGLILLVILVHPPAQAAPARTYNSSQIGTTRGASEDPSNWFYQVQPLSAKVQPMKAPTVGEMQKAVTQSPAAKADKDVQAIPPPRPKRKTDKDTRKIDVTKSAEDKKVVFDNTAVADKAQVKASISRTAYDSSLFEQVGQDPNARDKSKSTDSAFTPVPKPKKRNHGLGDWP